MLSDLGKRMLVITARRGYTGADREVFFHFIRGIRYSEMEKEVQALEREGLISIEWVGPSNFTVSITAHGVKVAKEIEEGVWHKSIEALELRGREKHQERSILEEKGEHSYTIKDKTKVQEVGSLPTDIMQTLDEQIIAERQAAYEEENGLGVGIPATEKWEEDYEGEEDVVERRIEGELDYSESEEGEEIYLNAGEMSSEDRIVQDEKSRIRKRVKERRIEGELNTPDFDDEEALPMEENPIHLKNIDDKISEFYSKTPNDGEYHEISQEIEEDVDEDIREEPVMEEELDELQAYDDEDLSNLDLYKQIVDTISLDSSRSTGGGSGPLGRSNEFFCLWEAERPCPLKMKKDVGKKITITPNHCMVCQLIEIKNVLKEKND